MRLQGQGAAAAAADRGRPTRAPAAGEDDVKSASMGAGGEDAALVRGASAHPTASRRRTRAAQRGRPSSRRARRAGGGRPRRRHEEEQRARARGRLVGVLQAPHRAERGEAARTPREQLLGLADELQRLASQLGDVVVARPPRPVSRRGEKMAAPLRRHGDPGPSALACSRSTTASAGGARRQAASAAARLHRRHPHALRLQQRHRVRRPRLAASRSGARWAWPASCSASVVRAARGVQRAHHPRGVQPHRRHAHVLASATLVAGIVVYTIHLFVFDYCYWFDEFLGVTPSSSKDNVAIRGRRDPDGGLLRGVHLRGGAQRPPVRRLKRLGVGFGPRPSVGGGRGPDGYAAAKGGQSASAAAPSATPTARRRRAAALAVARCASVRLSARACRAAA